MPKVMAYQSKFDKRVYSLDQRDKYIKHLKKIRKRNTEDRFTEKALNEFESFRNNAADSITTIEELEQWVMDNIKQIIYSNKALASRSIFDNIPTNTALLKFSLDNMRYNDHISNSHNAPRDGVTNWHSEPSKPSGYPGVRGRVNLLSESRRNEGSSPGFSDILTKLGICTGSGGSSSYYKEQKPTQYCSGYEVILFDSDWPCLAVTRKLNS